MKQVETVIHKDIGMLEQNVNELIEHLGCDIFDIKYAATDEVYSAMIIYEKND